MPHLPARPLPALRELALALHNPYRSADEPPAKALRALALQPLPAGTPPMRHLLLCGALMMPSRSS